MKVIAFFLLFYLVNDCFLERIIIHTKSDEHIYNFFPLRTNYLEFTVKAKNDVCILLSNTYDRKAAYYEIGIGVWANSKSVIRKDTDELRVDVAGAQLNSSIYQKFWIAINDTDESISVGKQYGKAFMYYQDPDYVKMSYFGISTGFGSGGDWNFDFDLLKCNPCY